MTRDSTATPSIDAGWLAMTNEARRIQMRYANHHQGDVYHELQHLVTRFGAPWNGAAAHRQEACNGQQPGPAADAGEGA